MVSSLLVRVNQDAAQDSARNSGATQKRRVQNGKVVGVAALFVNQVQGIGVPVSCLWQNFIVLDKVVKDQLRLPVRIFHLEDDFWKQLQNGLVVGRNYFVGAGIGLVKHPVLFLEQADIILVHFRFHSARSDDIILPRARIIFCRSFVGGRNLKNGISPVIQERGLGIALGHNRFGLQGGNNRARQVNRDGRRVAALYVVEVRAHLNQVSVAACPSFFADAALDQKRLQGRPPFACSHKDGA